MPGIETIRNHPITLPELDKQKKIAAVLVSLDKQIKRNKEMVQKLQCFKPALNFSENGGMEYAG